MTRTLIAVAVLLAGCRPPGTDGALRVVLEVDEALRADCVELEVSAAGATPQRTLLSLSSGKPEYLLAVKQGALPRKVSLTASAFQGPCAAEAERRLATQAGPVDASFPTGAVTEVRLKLGPPSPALDADRDGFVDAKKGGADCNDADGTVFPGGKQVCTAEVDTNCNALLYCEDPDCAGTDACLHAATRLAFAPAALSVVTGACVGARLETQDFDGGVAPLGRPTLAVLGDADGVQFFSESSCDAGLTRVPLAFGQSAAQLFLRTAKSGPAAATASDVSATRPLLPASLSVVGHSHRVALEGIPARLPSGTCSGPVAVRLENAQGLPFAATAALDVNVVATGPAASGLSFFGSATDCTGTGAPTLQHTLAAASTGFTFSFRGTQTGALTLVASGSGAPDSVTLAIGPGAPEHLQLTGAGAPVVAGDCSGPVDVELRDVANKVVPAPGAFSLALSSTATATAPLQFFSDGACGAPATTATVPSGESHTVISFRAVRAPENIDVKASAGSVAGQLAFAILPSAPVALGFKLPVQAAVTRYVCSSSPFTVQLRDRLGNPAPAPQNDVLTLASSSGAVEFHDVTPGACAGAPISEVTLGGGRSEVPFLLAALGLAGGQTTVKVTSAVYGELTLPVPIVDGLGALAVTTPAVVEAGGCVPVTVTRRRAGGAAVTVSTAQLTLQSGDPAVTVHTDPGCISAGVASAALARGSSAATFYAQGHSSDLPQVALTATATPADYADGTGDLIALPLVRRGICVIAQSAASRSCSLVPALPGDDISRTFLVYQAAPDAWTPTDASVECHLSTQAQVVCSRAGTNNLAPVAVSWQTVSWGRSAASGGVSVQHLTGPAAGLAPVTQPFAAVAPARSFLLYGSSGPGAQIGGNDFSTASLTSATQLTVSPTVALGFPPLSYSAQVVEFAGADVERGVLSVQLGASLQATAVATAALGRTIGLFTVRLDTASSDDVLCKRRFRGEVTDGTHLGFHRGHVAVPGTCTAGTVEELAWERVQFPPGTVVQAVDLSLASGAMTQTASISPIAPHRTIALAGGMGPGGQNAGESDYQPTATSIAAGTADDLGVLHGVFSFPSTTSVKVERGSGGPPGETANARFTAYVVQFAP